MRPATLVSGAGASPWEARLVGELLSRHSGVQVLARCFELAQVLAAASRVRPDVVLVGHDLDGLDREAVAELARSCRAVIGAYPPGDPDAVRRLIDLGCERAVPHDLDPLDLARLVLELAGRETAVAGDQPTPAGRLLAVWGPAGAPGRTTVATGLAAGLARPDEPVLLVDADTYGGAVAQTLGLPETPSLVGAVHQASVAGFGPDQLLPFCHDAGAGLLVLAGLGKAEMWPEVREASLRAVLEAAQARFAVTVVDVGFCLEEDEELSYSGAPMRRNLATRVVLAKCDSVVALCRADPVGVRRYLQARPVVAEVARGPIATVVTRSPGSVAGRRKMEMSLALERHTGAPPIAFVPEDPAVLECLWEGRSVVRARPRSPAARGVMSLCRELTETWEEAS